MRSRKSALQLTSLSAVVLLTLPVLYITFLSLPGIDDYAFALQVKEQGIWGAQYYWYTSWTGRYASSLLLSLHPLLADSILGYQVLLFAVLLLSIFSLYHLCKHFFAGENRYLPLLAALSLFLLYFHAMPAALQGLYWLPGAYTYQLSNACMLLIGAMLLHSLKSGGQLRWKATLLTAFLVLFNAGLNEVGMLINLVLVGFAALARLLMQRRIGTDLMLLLGAALLGLVVVYFAPGSAARAGNSFDAAFQSLIGPSLIRSLKEAYYLAGIWWLKVGLSTVALGFAFGLSGAVHKINDRRAKAFSSVFSILLAVIFMVLPLFAGYYASGFYPPDRTINVCIWMALIPLFFLGLQLGGSFFRRTTFVPGNLRRWVEPAAAVIVCTVLFGASGNYAKALNDCFSEVPLAHYAEYKARLRKFHTCGAAPCIIPGYVQYSNLVNAGDYDQENESVWSERVARFYDLPGGIILNKSNRNPLVEASVDLKNGRIELREAGAHAPKMNSIESEILAIPSSQVFSPAARITFGELWESSVRRPYLLELSMPYPAINDSCEAHLVVTLNRTKHGAAMLWRSRVLTNEAQEEHGRMYLTIPIAMTSTLASDKLTIYLWNPQGCNLETSSILTLRVY